jgi:hypothetical protein
VTMAFARAITILPDADLPLPARKHCRNCYA